MKIVLLRDLPVEKKHGATKGRVFDISRKEENRVRGGVHYYFIGDAGEEVGVLIHEYDIIHDEEKAEWRGQGHK